MEFSADWTDAKGWLNRRIEKEGIDSHGAEKYLQSLTLSLQLYLQEAADQAEIAAGSLLGSRLASVETLRKQMATEQQDALERISDILALHANSETKAQDTMVAIKEAKDKIELIRRALKRKLRSVC